LQQAARDAEDVPGAYSQTPWTFRQAPGAAKRLLDAHAGRNAAWVVVTHRQGDAGAHTRERCYTAIQRYLLSLAAEGVEATWIASGLPPGLARASELPGAEDLLGVIRLGG
jgi:hypothetical protein